MKVRLDKIPESVANKIFLEFRLWGLAGHTLFRDKFEGWRAWMLTHVYFNALGQILVLRRICRLHLGPKNLSGWWNILGLLEGRRAPNEGGLAVDIQLVGGLDLLHVQDGPLCRQDLETGAGLLENNIFTEILRSLEGGWTIETLLVLQEELGGERLLHFAGFLIESSLFEASWPAAWAVVDALEEGLDDVVDAAFLGGVQCLAAASYSQFGSLWINLTACLVSN